jgi:uncharacterized protein YndB with AHSA1/START domain
MRMTTEPTLAPPEGLTLTITRVFDAPRRLVFKLWTQPEHLARWWGPEGFTTVSCAMDVRPGGAWFRCMRSPEGTLYTKRGVYREIVEPEHLVFTYANEGADGRLGPEMLVTVTFEQQGAQTKLTVHQAGFESASSRDAHQGGWTSCLERFAEYLAEA